MQCKHQIILLAFAGICSFGLTAPIEESTAEPAKPERDAELTDSEAAATETMNITLEHKTLEDFDQINDSIAENTNIPEALPFRVNLSLPDKPWIEEDYPEHVSESPPIALPVTTKPHAFSKTKHSHYLKPIKSTLKPVRYVINKQSKIREAQKIARRPEILSYPAALQGVSAQNYLSPLRIQTSDTNLQPRVKKGGTSTATFVPGSTAADEASLNVYVQPKQLFGQLTNQMQGGFRPPITHQQDDVLQFQEGGDAKYQFVYRVQDHGHKPVLNEHGQEVLGSGITSDFGHSEARNGKRTWGRYFVKLPDGRVQTVRYWADHTGYHAQVLFSGEAIHPRPHNHQSFGISSTAGVQYGHSASSPTEYKVEHNPSSETTRPPMTTTHYYVPKVAAQKQSRPSYSNQLQDQTIFEPREKQVEIQNSQELEHTIEI